MTPAQFQRRQAKLWRRAFFILLLISLIGFMYFYFVGHCDGQEFMEKRAATQMMFSNQIAGSGDSGYRQDFGK